jgi:sensor histidine kinase YesM
MENWLRKIYTHRHFLLFVMLFGYVQSIYLRVASKDEINILMFTPEAVFLALLQVGVLYTIILFFIKRWQRLEEFDLKESLKILSASLLVFPVIMQLIGLFISLLAGTIQRNFSVEILVYTTFTFFLQGITYGSFFLVYYYYQRNRNHKQQLASYHQALSEMRINQLKSQINPHFLFNNLNVLDQLIEEDKQQASDYLNEFAEIYRYVLQASDEKVISIEKELLFAKQYFSLFHYKYGNAYQLIIECTDRRGAIVPMTLQLLIENAVKHNIGSVEDPICIKLVITNEITVSNNINPKKSVEKVSGRALNNLKEQYKLLTGTPVQIITSNSKFEVVIPKIESELA